MQYFGKKTSFFFFAIHSLFIFHLQYIPELKER